MNLAPLCFAMGTQWYLLFNVIAGARHPSGPATGHAGLLQLSRWKRWRILILPNFPISDYRAVTASGGAWNASIVAEYSDLLETPVRHWCGFSYRSSDRSRRISVTTGSHPSDDYGVRPSTVWCGVALSRS